VSQGGSSAARAQRPIRIALALLIGVVIALVAAGAVTAYRIYTLGNHRFIDQAGPFFAVTEDLAVEMLNEETGVRGYVITGDPKTLAPYNQGRKYVKIELNLIAKDVSFDPKIPQHLVAMRRQVSLLEAFFANEVALVKSEPAGQRQAQQNILTGKGHFDHLRAASGALIADAGAVIKRSHREQRRTLILSLVFLVGVGLVAVGLAAALLLTVPRRLLRLYREEREARRDAERGADASRALAHVAEAVLLLDGGGSDGGAIRYWNPAAGAIFGLNDGELDPAEVGGTLEELRQASRGVPGPRPVTIDGRERWLVYAETPFDGGRVVVLRDVTDEQRLERLRVDFVATAAHELRTPLAAVYGAVRTLRQTEHELTEEVSAQFLGMIESEAERLKVVMDQLLVTAQLDREDVQMYHEKVDISNLCKSLVGAVEVRKPEAIEFAVDCPATEVRVDADAERLRQVVANLLDNAIKYSPSGGRVDLRVKERSGFGVIEVADRGLGIPAHEQHRIFEKFYRLDPAMTRGIGGSGLGLYISRELVRQMGGQLSVSSRLGEGSTFSVMLPLARAA
jgi:signal transduction histidine kinase